MSRDRNRAEFPGLASIVDAFRDAGLDVRLIHGEESGHEIGKRPTLPANVVEVDLFKAFEMAAMGQPKVRRK